MTTLKDGGTRKTYSTGAQKEDSGKTEGKGAYHLLPPIAVRAVAEIWRKGAQKYTRWSEIPTEKALTEMAECCSCRENNFRTQMKDTLLSSFLAEEVQELMKEHDPSCEIHQHYRYNETTNTVEKWGSGERNWEKGLPLSRFIDSALRHTFQYLEGLEDEEHLHQAAWNLLACIQTEEMIKRGLLPQELDDLPSYGRGAIAVHKSLVCDKWRERKGE